MRIAIVVPALVVACLAWSVDAHAQSLVYVARHAERADGGAGAAKPMSGGAPPDPSLSAAGVARAGTLAAMLADAGITAIYVTEFKRTNETAAPLAAKLGVTPKVLPAASTPALVADLKASHPHDVVLIVGHSNTIPEIIKALGGPAITVGDDEYDSLFVFVPATGRVSRIHY